MITPFFCLRLQELLVTAFATIHGSSSGNLMSLRIILRHPNTPVGVGRPYFLNQNWMDAND
ncbi:hypothetical protein [Pseudomonas chlororaphis]|uniref:hypothetical protein n=1 Tax=Pseudomonas chlororaphis TaxID=587753 RepID=UPI0012D3204E|nr:hypothetical protein [Pseudomonas chlororaphis]